MNPLTDGVVLLGLCKSDRLYACIDECIGGKVHADYLEITSVALLKLLSSYSNFGIGSS